MAASLTLSDVSLRFGGIKVLEDVTFTVEPGAIFGLVGPNGAGKTSLFNCISGHYRPSSGSIRIDEEEVLSKAPWRMSRLGLARTFQHPALQLQPRLLLLDEPAAGLPHSEVDNFIDQVRRMRTDFDVTIVIVEHHMGLISALTDRVVVLDHGRKLMEGTAAEAQADPRVIEAYIGKDAADDAA